MRKAQVLVLSALVCLAAFTMPAVAGSQKWTHPGTGITVTIPDGWAFIIPGGNFLEMKQTGDGLLTRAFLIISNAGSQSETPRHRAELSLYHTQFIHKDDSSFSASGISDTTMGNQPAAMFSIRVTALVPPNQNVVKPMTIIYVYTLKGANEVELSLCLPDGTPGSPVVLSDFEAIKNSVTF